jgi:hypothetical protein
VLWFFEVLRRSGMKSGIAVGIEFWRENLGHDKEVYEHNVLYNTKRISLLYLDEKDLQTILLSIK